MLKRMCLAPYYVDLWRFTNLRICRVWQLLLYLPQDGHTAETSIWVSRVGATLWESSAVAQGGKCKRRQIVQFWRHCTCCYWTCRNIMWYIWFFNHVECWNLTEIKSSAECDVKSIKSNFKFIIRLIYLSPLQGTRLSIQFLCNSNISLPWVQGNALCVAYWPIGYKSKKFELTKIRRSLKCFSS